MPAATSVANSTPLRMFRPRMVVPSIPIEPLTLVGVSRGCGRRLS